MSGKTQYESFITSQCNPEAGAVDPYIELISLMPAKGTNILIHCSGGLSRSVTLILVWLMKAKGLRLTDAVKLVMEARGRPPDVLDLIV